jgi:hypothetical protein
VATATLHAGYTTVRMFSKHTATLHASYTTVHMFSKHTATLHAGYTTVHMFSNFLIINSMISSNSSEGLYL